MMEKWWISRYRIGWEVYPSKTPPQSHGGVLNFGPFLSEEEAWSWAQEQQWEDEWE